MPTIPIPEDALNEESFRQVFEWAYAEARQRREERFKDEAESED